MDGRLLAVLSGGGGMGACNPVPPGYHQEPDYRSFVWAFGPGILTLLVTTYFALGIERLWLRWLAVIACLVLALAVTFVATATMPFSCGGRFVPN